MATTLHDPSYRIRRTLWFAYAVFALGLVLLLVALVRMHAGPTVARPPATPQPSAIAIPAGQAANPATGGLPRTTDGGQRASTTGSLTSTRSRPGEPPGDVEDDSGQPSTLPKLPVPTPSVPVAVSPLPLH